MIRFQDPSLDFVSDTVLERLQNEFLKVNINAKIKTLIANDETGTMNSACPKLYEEVISEKMTSKEGLDCKQQELSLSQQTISQEGKPHVDNWKDHNFKVKDLILGASPPYNEMKKETLYYPTRQNFPFVEFFYKDADENLVAFQVTRQETPPKYISRSAFAEFLEGINFPEDQVGTKLKLILIPSPKYVSDFYLKITNKNAASETAQKKYNLNLIKNYTILKIDYVSWLGLGITKKTN